MRHGWVMAEKKRTWIKSFGKVWVWAQNWESRTCVDTLVCENTPKVFPGSLIIVYCSRLWSQATRSVQIRKGWLPRKLSEEHVSRTHWRTHWRALGAPKGWHAARLEGLWWEAGPGGCCRAAGKAHDRPGLDADSPGWRRRCLGGGKEMWTLWLGMTGGWNSLHGNRPR